MTFQIDLDQPDPYWADKSEAHAMSETSEMKDRVELEDNAVWFDNKMMFNLGAKATSGGIEEFIELADADVLDALNAALNQPVPCGVLTEELIERLAFLRVRGIGRGEVICDECGKYWMESEPTQHADNCILSRARSAQQGETVTVRRSHELMLATLKGYEQWEANILMDNVAWESQAEHPTLTDSLWNQLLFLQACRNQAIAEAEAEAALAAGKGE